MTRSKLTSMVHLFSIASAFICCVIAINVSSVPSKQGRALHVEHSLKPSAPSYQFSDPKKTYKSMSLHIELPTQDKTDGLYSNNKHIEQKMKRTSPIQENMRDLMNYNWPRLTNVLSRPSSENITVEVLDGNMQLKEKLPSLRENLLKFFNFRNFNEKELIIDDHNVNPLHLHPDYSGFKKTLQTQININSRKQPKQKGKKESLYLDNGKLTNYLENESGRKLLKNQPLTVKENNEADFNPDNIEHISVSRPIHVEEYLPMNLEHLSTENSSQEKKNRSGNLQSTDYYKTDKIGNHFMRSFVSSESLENLEMDTLPSVRRRKPRAVTWENTPILRKQSYPRHTTDRRVKITKQRLTDYLAEPIAIGARSLLSMTHPLSRRTSTIRNYGFLQNHGTKSLMNPDLIQSQKRNCNERGQSYNRVTEQYFNAPLQTQSQNSGIQPALIQPVPVAYGNVNIGPINSPNRGVYSAWQGNPVTESLQNPIFPPIVTANNPVRTNFPSEANLPYKTTNQVFNPNFRPSTNGFVNTPKNSGYSNLYTKPEYPSSYINNWMDPPTSNQISFAVNSPNNPNTVGFSPEQSFQYQNSPNFGGSTVNGFVDKADKPGYENLLYPTTWPNKFPSDISFPSSAKNPETTGYPSEEIIQYQSISLNPITNFRGPPIVQNVNNFEYKTNKPGYENLLKPAEYSPNYNNNWMNTVTSYPITFPTVTANNEGGLPPADTSGYRALGQVLNVNSLPPTFVKEEINGFVDTPKMQGYYNMLDTLLDPSINNNNWKKPSLSNPITNNVLTKYPFDVQLNPYVTTTKPISYYQNFKPSYKGFSPELGSSTNPIGLSTMNEIPNDMFYENFSMMPYQPDKYFGSNGSINPQRQPDRRNSQGEPVSSNSGKNGYFLLPAESLQCLQCCHIH